MEISIKTMRMKWIVAFIACCVCLQALMIPTAHAASVNDQAKARGALEKVENWLLDKGNISDWTAIGLAANDKTVPLSYQQHKGDEVLTNRAVYEAVSELSLSMLGYYASGVDTSNIAGINMMSYLVNHQAMEKEGGYGLALAYIAYLATPHGFLDRPFWYPDLWYYKLVENQLSDGSWSGAEGQDGDIQSTMLVLSSLRLAYGSPTDTLEPIINNALDYVMSKQHKDGSWSGSTLETAYAIMALLTADVDPSSEQGESIQRGIAYLLSQQTKGGSFVDTISSKDEKIVSEQAYLALTAYERWLSGEGQLFEGLKNMIPNHVTVTIEGPNGLIATGQSTGYTVEEAVLQFLQSSNIDYQLNNKYEIGAPNNFVTGYAQMILSLGGTANGNSDQKAWRYAMRSQGEQYSQANNTSSTYEGAEILLYYGAASKGLYAEIAVKNGNTDEYSTGSNVYTPNKPFSIKLTKQVFNTGYSVMKVVSGATVQLNGKTYTSNKEGIIQVNGLESGKYPITISDASGTFVTTRTVLTVSAPEYTAYEDAANISKWAIGGIGHSLSDGIMKGTSKSPLLLSPKKAVTRAEFVTMIMRALNTYHYDNTKTWFSDVKLKDWYSKDINTARLQGITDVSTGAFRPNDAITREEAAIMLTNAGLLKTYGTPTRHAFNDVQGLSDVSKHAIQAVDEHGIMQGDLQTFRPYQSLTREEAATVIMRLDYYVHRSMLYGWMR